MLPLQLPYLYIQVWYLPDALYIKTKTNVWTTGLNNSFHILNPFQISTSTQKYNKMSTESWMTEAIPIYHDVTATQFRDSIQSRRLPAVLRGVDVGPCVDKWSSLHYLLDHIEDKLVKVKSTVEIHPKLYCRTFLYSKIFTKTTSQSQRSLLKFLNRPRKQNSDNRAFNLS